jgi:acyl-CoA reductase-like NAD-dependent aldehyde dehydrogenase
MANATQYGLAGSVWTADEVRGFDVASRVESGILWVNCWLYRDLRTPFGGVKQSGVGREGGIYSVGFFSETSNVCVKLAHPRVSRADRVKRVAALAALATIGMLVAAKFLRK